jgi:deoxyribodipyrimidine photo-lyase
VSDFLPSTRAEALARLDAFLPRAGAYAARRNFVEPGHGNVSRLSPATRSRLLLEREIVAAARAVHDPAAVEKFEQEVAWRRYWKGWLERRPAVWCRYRAELASLGWSPRARAVAAGESGVAMMDHFARELVETGYLHNHARMWWASFWTHVECLPWQLGADWFLRHLLDGDAASNTLSWRWVAGLHTPGKTYLVRRSNLERYVDPDLLAAHREGLDRLEAPLALAPVAETIQPPTPPEGETDFAALAGRRWGLWLHDEDLLPEDSPLAALGPGPVSALATAPLARWRAEGYAMPKTDFLRSVLADGAERTARHFGIACPLREAEDLGQTLAAWARGERLELVAAMRPFVGPLAEELGAVEAALAREGIGLLLARRPEDAEAMRLATGGFFGFWKGLCEPSPAEGGK